MRCLFKTEGESYQFGFGPRQAEKLHSHWHPDGSICRRHRKAGWHFDGREARQRRDNTIAVFLKRCPDGKDQTFLMGIHERIQLISRHEVGHFNPDLIHSHTAVFIVRGIGAIFITLRRGKNFSSVGLWYWPEAMISA